MQLNFAKFQIIYKLNYIRCSMKYRFNVVFNFENIAILLTLLISLCTNNINYILFVFI